MTIKTFDAFSRMSIIDIDRITNFIYNNSDEFGDTKTAIRKSILYAAKEILGLGGYVFVMEDKNKILGTVVVNRTGMDEYLSENIIVYVVVKEGYRNMGIAKKIIKHTIKYCKGNIAVHINIDNPVISLFENIGFKSRNIEMRLER